MSNVQLYSSTYKIYRRDAGAKVSTVSLFTKWRVTNRDQKFARKEISRPGFLDVSRHSVVSTPYRLTSSLLLRKYFDMHFCEQRVIPGLVWRAVLQLSFYVIFRSYNFINHHTIIQICMGNSAHTGPRADLRLDAWSWANSGLETTFALRHHHNRKILGGHQGRLNKRTVGSSWYLALLK